MKVVRRYGLITTVLLGLGLVLLPLTAPAQGRVPGRPAPLTLTDRQDRYPLGRHLELLEDPTGQLTIEEVSSPAYDAQFTPSQAEVPNLGYTTSAVWVRFQVRDEAESAAGWRLAMADARPEYVDLYLPGPDGMGVAHQQAGSARPFTAREVPYRYPVFKLPLPPGRDQIVYLRFQSATTMELPLTLWALEAFTQHAQTELLRFGLFYGIMLVMLGYNLFLFASLRDRSYLYLVMFITSFGLNDASREGLVQQYLWPAWPNLYGNWTTATLTYITALLFGATFLQTKVRTPRLYKVMMVVMAIALLTLILNIMVGWLFEAHTILVLLTVLLLVAAGYVTSRQGYRPARYFLLAWLLLMGTSTLHNLANSGLLPGTPFSQQAVRIGAALMVLLLSLALADRINLLKAATEQANEVLTEEIQVRKSAQQALGESEKKYRTVVEQGTEGILIVQGDRRKYYNPALLEMTGYSAEEYDSIPFLSLVYPDDLEAVETVYQNLVMGQEFEAVLDFRIISKSGEIKWLSLHSARIEWEGQPAGMAFIKDITQRKQAEEALHESEQRFYALFEYAAIGIALVDPKGHPFISNPALMRFLGYSAEELRGMEFREFTHPEDVDADVALFNELIANRRDYYQIEKRYLTKDGRTVWGQLTVSIVQDKDGGVEFAIGMVEDITERKQAEEALRESETRFRATFEQAAVGITHVALNGTFLRLNRKFCDIVGYSHDEMVARTFQDITHPDDLSTDLEYTRQLLTGEAESYAMEKRYFHQDGEMIWVNLTRSLVRQDTGAPDYFVAVVEDITRRKQAEEALQERKERYRRALEAGLIMLWQWDRATDHIELDGAVEQMLGYSYDELDTGAKQGALTPLEDQALILKAWGDLLEGRSEKYSIVHRFLRKDGSLCWIEAKGSTVKDEKGQVIRILGTSRDITATRRAEEMVAERTAELVEANQNLQQQITERHKIEAALRQVQGQLEQRVAERTVELEQANRQLTTLLDILEQRVADRTRELTTFLDLTMLVSEARSLTDILEAAIDRVMEVGQCQAVCLHLPSQDQNSLELVVQRGLLHEQQQRLQSLSLADSLVDWLAQRHEPVLDLSIAATPLPAVLHLDGFQSYLGAQLRVREQGQGLLSYYRQTGPHFSLDEISLLAALAEQLGIVIENHRLRDRIEEIAVVAERQRLARELHDSITQSLYSLNLFAHAGRQAAEDGDEDRLDDSLARVETITLAVLKEMRLLLYQLQPEVLAEKGLGEALQIRFDTVERRLGIRVDYQAEGQLAMPAEVVEALYRAALEALNNALKHAEANQMVVRLEMVAPTITLTIADNGRGFDPERISGGMGLRNIRERLEQFDGCVKISSVPGDGTTVEFAVSVDGVSDNR